MDMKKELVINKAICWLNQHVVNFNDCRSLLRMVRLFENQIPLTDMSIDQRGSDNHSGH